ncbi:MAG: stage II sporulation protein D [Clostridia bacterium]|nr:stage II sporulation protein D [Clostridia bacterium]
MQIAKKLSMYIFFIFIIYFIPFLFSVGISSPVPSAESESPSISTKTVSVFFKSKDKVERVLLEEYIPGVIAAEMPASFPLEALKAQAVASRSYILDKIASGGNKIAEHKGADICTDSTHCKAWISKEERFEKWAESEREKNWTKICTAVQETAGEYMSFEGKPITAVFYAISSGTTERAADVWGSDIPYLQNADSHQDKNAPDYRSSAEFSKEEFRKKIMSEFPDIFLGKSPSGWYHDEIRSSGGAVLSCRLGDTELKGTDVRRIFGLRSHNYTLTYKEGKFIFDVVGYGHGVGMSQWGAKFYADEGKNYRDILRIYYKGISFEKPEPQ